MKKIINQIVNFWLDYSVSGYNNLKKHDNDPEIDILLNTSFIQSLNLNLVLVLIFKCFDFKLSDYKYLIITTLVLIAVNYFWYNKLTDNEKNKLKSRTPKFKKYVYRFYAVFSGVLLLFIGYLLSSN